MGYALDGYVTVLWNCLFFSHGKTKIVADTNSNMVVILFHDRITLLVMRHLRSKALLKAGKVNFLGFYIVDFKGLSYHTHGLLGTCIIISILMFDKILGQRARKFCRLRTSV